MRVVVDGMGGDKAPAAIVKGAYQAAQEYGHRIIIAGRQDAIRTELAKCGPALKNISVCHAETVVEMGEPAIASLRAKKDSSISVAVDLLKQNEADAFVSAGNTGAVVCATTYKLGMLSGVDRPGIAIVVPTLDKPALIIDVGANIDPKPIHLVEYAIMGDAYQRYILKTDNPSVGLLSVGEEESKGTDFIKETFRLLNLTKLNFIGNVEGKDIYRGTCDVIVCDGFVGNIILKVSESMASVVTELLKRKMTNSPLSRIGAFFCRPALQAIKREIDYSEYGGAPLLGVDGICIISHGKSSAKAIKNAIRVAGEFVEHQVNGHIAASIKNLRDKTQ